MCVVLAYLVNRMVYAMSMKRTIFRSNVLATKYGKQAIRIFKSPAAFKKFRRQVMPFMATQHAVANQESIRDITDEAMAHKMMQDEFASMEQIDLSGSVPFPE